MRTLVDFENTEMPILSFSAPISRDEAETKVRECVARHGELAPLFFMDENPEFVFDELTFYHPGHVVFVRGKTIRVR